MLVINSIEKTRLSADSYSYSGTGVAWKARLVLFLGFALMAGGLAGSVVSALFDMVVTGTRRLLTNLFAGCLGFEVYRARLPIPNIVLRSCECNSE